GPPLFAGRPKPGGSPAPSPAPVPSPIPVSECTGAVLLSEDFKQVDTSWSIADEAITIEDGKLKMKPQAGKRSGFIYPGRVFKDADYCLTIQSPNNLKEQSDPSSLAFFVFWGPTEPGIVSFCA